MAIQYVGGRGAGRAGATSTVNVAISSGLTGGIASAASADDLCVVTVSVATQARAPALAITAPAGFTALTAQRTTATTYDANVQTCYKKLTAGDITAGITIPSTGNIADGQGYNIQIFRGVDLATPMDATATYATGSGTNNLPNGAVITPVTAGAWVVVCGGGAAATGTTLFTAAALTNFVSYNGADTNDGTVGAGYYTGWSSGSYDPAAFGGGSANAANSWGCTTLALRPAATVITGIGALASQAADVTGTGLSSSISTDGAIAAQAADVTGVGLSASLGTGALTAQAATVAGSGTVEAASISGTGALTAQSALVDGAGLSVSLGIGILAAQASATDGVGLSASSGSGAIASQAADIDGVGISVSLGTGALVSQAAIVVGTGTVGIIDLIIAAARGLICSVGRFMNY